MKKPNRTEIAVLARAFAGATKTWRAGDRCQSFRGPGTTEVVRVEGESVYLADGTSGHISRMRLP